MKVTGIHGVLKDCSTAGKSKDSLTNRDDAGAKT